MSEESRPEQGQEKSIRCHHCNTITAHKNIFQHYTFTTADEDYNPQNPDSTYQDLEEIFYISWVCLGCKNVTFEVKNFMEFPDGITRSNVNFYPEYNSNKKSTKNFKILPSEIISIYRESVLCYNTGAYRASAVCLRAALEGILSNKGITGKDLYTKIENFASQGILSNDIAKLLHTFRFMGNEAIHDLTKINPSLIEIKYAIEAIEIMIDYMYEAQNELKTKMRILTRMRDSESGE
ncbi:DUF4145 domain-containing protein [Herpetosiphon sp. NSE202]|uniref:DUF4145 domain-containing protein n=1 Tax=Herpetosiphon sp. NSE202 TaxID=3351349 RepID=UPI003632465C